MRICWYDHLNTDKKITVTQKPLLKWTRRLLIKKLLFGLTLFVSIPSFASGYSFQNNEKILNDDVCQSEQIIKIKRPYNKKTNKMFDYSFRYLRGEKFGLPVIVNLPGGPGGTSIYQKKGYDPRVLLSYGYVQTDPRGVGCNTNYLTHGTAEDINTEVLADDIIAVIQALRLRKYILLGTSYGTTLATVVASKISKLKMPQPQSLVFQGVMGRAYKGIESQQGFIDEWEIVKRRISQKHLEKISKSVLPLGLSSGEWAKWIKSVLYVGDIKGSFDGHRLGDLTQADQFNMYFSLLENDETKPFLKSMILDANNTSTEMFNIYNPLYCHELSNNTKITSHLIRGELILNEPHFDEYEDIEHDNLYDSKHWQVNSRIYYFNGDHDPVLPLYQAKYHYDSQKSEDKVFITVKGAGHNALHSLDKCKVDIWMDILNNEVDLSESIRKCDYSFEIE